jgi:acylaminoacyl-peptidase
MTTISDYSRIFSESSTITKGWLRSSNDNDQQQINATISHSVRDIDEDKTKMFCDNYMISSLENDEEILKKISSNLPAEIVKPIAMDLSPSGNKVIFLRHGKDDKPLIEIHNNEDNNQNMIIDSSEVHGKFVGDSWFGGVSWSSDETYVTYVANIKEKKTISHFEDENKSNQPPGSRFEYKEDWGEKYESVCTLCICVVDTTSGTVRMIPNIDTSLYTVGQPSFVPSSSSTSIRLTYTAWNINPRKLGMIYCYQRQCSIFITDISTLFTNDITFNEENDSITAEFPLVTHQILTSSFRLARSSRFNSKGDKMAFLGNKLGFSSHNGSSQLCLINGILNDINGLYEFNIEPVIIIDTVSLPSNSYKNGFPGLFSDQLPCRCFIERTKPLCNIDERVDVGDFVVLNSQWCSTAVILVVSLSNGTITKLSGSELISNENMIENNHGKWNNNNEFSTNVLDIQNHQILYSISSPTMTSRVGIYDIETNAFIIAAKRSNYSIKCKKSINKSLPNDNQLKSLSLSDLKFKIMKLQDDDGIPFEAILITPPVVEGKLLPLITVPHGGPHSCMPTSYVPSYAFLAIHLNSAVLHCNYRGSTGFGQRSIDSLLGTIGTNDVQDVLDCTNMAINEGYINKDLVAIVGGSHGGFLCGHMIGQYPDLFRVACMRNPVTNIPSMVGVTDIPDWCFVEALGADSYDFNSFNTPSDEDLLIMRYV